MAGEKGPTKRSAMDIKRLASLIQRGTGRLLVIDSRTFSEYNASHVQGAVNVCCSKLVKRRLQQDKVSVTELLQPNGKVKVSSNSLYLTVDASDRDLKPECLYSKCQTGFKVSVWHTATLLIRERLSGSLPASAMALHSEQ